MIKGFDPVWVPPHQVRARPDRHRQYIITQDKASGTGTLQVTASTTSDAVIKAGGNWAGITQQGSGNANTFINQGNTASSNVGNITQFGSNNRQTSIDQSSTSSGNTATILQGADGKPVNLNSAIITQQNTSFGNTALINQTSASNTALLNQSDNSKNNQATINQNSANGNETANVSQYFFTSISRVDVTQAGSGDVIKIQTSGSYLRQRNVHGLAFLLDK